MQSAADIAIDSVANAEHFTPGVTAGFTHKPLTSLVLATSLNTVGESDEEAPRRRVMGEGEGCVLTATALTICNWKGNRRLFAYKK